MNRRQFFKTIAATAAGIATAAVVPDVVKSGGVGVGGRAKHIVMGQEALMRTPFGSDINGMWGSYYADHDWDAKDDPVLRAKLDAIVKTIKFNYPFGW